MHPIRIRHKVGRKIPAIELHPFDDIQSGLGSPRLFNCDDAVFADFLHRVGDNAAYGGIVVGRNCSRGLRNILVAEATFLDTSRLQPRYATSERGAGYFIELFTANICDRNP